MAFAGHVGVALNVDLLVTEGDGISDSRADYGDAKNWAGQVGARREELTLKALFNEELGVVLQVRTDERNEVMQVLRDAWPVAAQPFRRQDPAGQLDLDAGKGEFESGATPRPSSAPAARTCTRSGTRSAGRSAASATTPLAPTAEHAAAGDRQDPGLQCC